MVVWGAMVIAEAMAVRAETVGMAALVEQGLLHLSTSIFPTRQEPAAMEVMAVPAGMGAAAVTVELAEPVEAAEQLKGVVYLSRVDRWPSLTTLSPIIPLWVAPRPPEGWVVRVQRADKAARAAPEDAVVEAGTPSRGQRVGVAVLVVIAAVRARPVAKAIPAKQVSPGQPATALAGQTEEGFMSPAARSACSTARLPTMTSAAVRGGGLDAIAGTVTLDNTIVALKTSGPAPPTDDIAGTISSAKRTPDRNRGFRRLVQHQRQPGQRRRPQGRALAENGGPTQTIALPPAAPPSGPGRLQSTISHCSPISWFYPVGAWSIGTYQRGIRQPPDSVLSAPTSDTRVRRDELHVHDHLYRRRGITPSSLAGRS